MKHEYLARVLFKKHIENIESDASTAFDTFKLLEEQENADQRSESQDDFDAWG